VEAWCRAAGRVDSSLGRLGAAGLARGLKKAARAAEGFLASPPAMVLLFLDGRY